MSTSRETLDEQLQVLRKKAYSELAQLPPYQERAIDCSDGRHTVAIWKDPVGGAELRVVVQAYKHVLLGVGLMKADGFRMAQSGRILNLSTEELEDFS